MQNELRTGFGLADLYVRPPSGAVEHPDGSVRHVHPTAMEVLLCLANKPGEIVAYSDFCREVWDGKPVSRATLSHRISELRQALDDHADDPRFIQTLPNRGYCLLVQPVPDTGNAPLNAPRTAGKHSKPIPAADELPTGIERLVREMRERKVFRVAALYTVTAWLILQVVDVVCGPLACAPWLPRATILTVVAGFPVALILAWVFDIQRTPGRLLDMVLVATTAAAVGLFLYIVYLYEPIPRVPLPADSVAVLPFRDLSAARDQDYFCKGVAEEIIHRLARLPRLKVASMTDTFALPDNTGIEGIRKMLGVRHVLAGSVRRQQQRLRITTQLIDTQTGFHVWTQDYERDLEDVFDIQDDIAQRVVESLNLVIRAGKDPDKPRNLDAYEYYLKGRAQLRGRRSNESLEAAERLFSQSIAADPDYAGAHAGLCDTYLTHYELNRARTFFDSAKAACNRALELEFVSAPVHVALGNLYRVSGEYRLAQKHFNEALDADPYDVDAFVGKARTFARQNKLAKAERSLERTLEIQPEFWRGHLQMGNFLFNDGRYREAIPYYRRVAEQLVDDAVALNNLGSAYFMAGDFDAALQEWRQSLELEPTRTAYSNVGSSLFYSRRFDEAAEMYRRAIELAPEDYEMYGNLASAQVQMGKNAEAQRNFQRAAALGEIALDVNPKDAYTTAALSVYYAALAIPGRATELIATAKRLAPNDMYMFYEAARAHVLLNQPGAAVAALRRAVELGYPNVLIPADAALDPLRHHPELQAILEARPGK